jgi:hypothetical protein
MRALALAVVLVACTSAKESTKEAPAAATAAAAKSPALEPAPRPAPEPAPGAGRGPAARAPGPITAAEAAAIAAGSGSAGDSPATAAPADDSPAAVAPGDDSQCETDDDCGLTRVGLAENACCPMLCTPRVVTKARAAELHARIATCSAGRRCPQPTCRPPRERVTPACVEHLCVAVVSVDAGDE